MILYKRYVTKYLGIYINKNLTLDQHINFMILKISAKIGILRNVVNLDTLKLIWYDIVQPMLLLCITQTLN